MRRSFPLLALVLAVLLGAGVARAGWGNGYDEGFDDGVTATTEAIEAADDGEAPTLQVITNERDRRGGGGFVLVPLVIGVLLVAGMRRRARWAAGGRDPRERLERWHDAAHRDDGSGTPAASGSDPGPPGGPSWPDDRAT